MTANSIANEYSDGEIPNDNNNENLVRKVEPSNSQTPAQAKADAIAALTMTAYARASELKLTPEEDEALGEDFPDEAFRAGAGGDEKLIYIEHAYLRDRFNNVLGRGAWSLVKRREWTEEKGPAVIVYAEVMLCVRGCYVAEAVGEMAYYPTNNRTTYADAMEGAKTSAFRRLAKDFGVGLQAWKKGYSEGWWARKKATANRSVQTPDGPATQPPRKPISEAWLKAVKECKTKARANELWTAYSQQKGIPDEELKEFGELLDAQMESLGLGNTP